MRTIIGHHCRWRHDRLSIVRNMQAHNITTVNQPVTAGAIDHQVHDSDTLEIVFDQPIWARFFTLVWHGQDFIASLPPPSTSEAASSTRSLSFRSIILLRERHCHMLFHNFHVSLCAVPARTEENVFGLHSIRLSGWRPQSNTTALLHVTTELVQLLKVR